ncbi:MULTISPECIES: FosX/FosE/FosI family fosfomycin resistance hydrolase [Listeria]|uniref:FosX/FosE/FosI family fosfomycin resistance hydrolase n=1 Tax=Listeria TaxID=1637 RepID=UPI000B590A3E|nr:MULTISPECIES: FosX/FosE/FosI family fosfomycin resistance hydrolase [Listeria]
MIRGLSHMTFIVADLDKATLFFEKIFDAKEVYASGDQTFSLAEEKFFLIDDIWIAIMKGETPLQKTYNHIAFKIETDDFEHYYARIQALGLEIKETRARISGEGESIYFYDFDQHLFELHTGTLGTRLEAYNKQNKDGKI